MTDDEIDAIGIAQEIVHVGERRNSMYPISMDDLRNFARAIEQAARATAEQSEPDALLRAFKRIEALRKGLFDARDAMRVMSNWVTKSDPAGHSWAVRMVDRANDVLSHKSQQDAAIESKPGDGS